jgi:hypothetical protein
MSIRRAPLRSGVAAIIFLRKNGVYSKQGDPARATRTRELATSIGKQLGRPRIAPELEARILAALKAPGRTEGVRKIAKRFGVDPGTVQRIRGGLNAAP